MYSMASDGFSVDVLDRVAFVAVGLIVTMNGPIQFLVSRLAAPLVRIGACSTTYSPSLNLVSLRFAFSDAEDAASASDTNMPTMSDMSVKECSSSVRYSFALGKR